jgi:hypothetical protein
MSKPRTMLLILALLASPALADERREQQLERWFESDTDAPPFTSEVNEGELTFLTKVEKQPPTSHNTINISADSLKEGWVHIEQCHENLDAFLSIQVVYRYHKMRNLTIVSTKDIGKAWVEGQSIQMLNVKKGATLCSRLEARILYKGKDNTYTLVNGPFERRFLDGFYPMGVKLDIHYPANLLTFETSEPKPQPGFELKHDTGKIQLNALFEGQLIVEMRFRKKEK